jgi:hypothetical protein
VIFAVIIETEVSILLVGHTAVTIGALGYQAVAVVAVAAVDAVDAVTAVGDVAAVRVATVPGAAVATVSVLFLLSSLVGTFCCAARLTIRNYQRQSG